jgi:hypothetical protein
MSFDDDNDPIVFVREATTIRFTTTDGELIDAIELPALRLRRSEVSPRWLAMHDAEQEAPDEGEEKH